MPPKISQSVTSLLWGGKSLKQKVVEDQSWSLYYKHQSADRCEVVVKIGNKEYALSSVTDTDEKKSKITESGIYRKYRLEPFFSAISHFGRRWQHLSQIPSRALNVTAAFAVSKVSRNECIASC